MNPTKRTFYVIRNTLSRLVGVPVMRNQIIETLSRRLDDLETNLSAKLPTATFAIGQGLVANVAVFGENAIRSALGVYGALLVNDYDRAVAIGNEADIPAEALRRIIEHVNHAVLFPRRLEWTSHGVRRSFRFWSEEELRTYLGEANRIIGILQETLTPHVSFGFGTVLGCMRAGMVIQHDDDVDVILSLPAEVYHTIPAGLDAAREALDRAGVHSFHWARSLIKTHTSVGRDLDFFVGIQEGPFVSWFPGPRKQILFEDVFPTVQRNLNGVSCPMPAHPSSYLEKIYGSDWMVPNSSFAHQWDSTDLDDLLVQGPQ